MTIATIREPCERWVSIYRQFESTYAAGNALCRYYTALCRSHWVRKAKNASDFFYLTRDRWLSVLGTPSITLADRHPGRFTSDRKPVRYGHYLPIKYGIHAVPQALWIGNYSIALCVGPRLRDDVRKQREQLYCRGSPSPLLSDSRLRYNARDEYAPIAPAEASRYELSPTVCGDVRRLYDTDTALWTRLCE